ncbi:MAG: HAD hydrolase family protein [Dehalococcoidales bacterium]
MIRVDIPGRGVLEMRYLALDLNGTLSVDGGLIEGVCERIDVLRERVEILIITADTHGKAQELAAILKVKMHKISAGDERTQKLKLVQQLGAENTVSIGNGANDVSMLKAAGLGICVLGNEGTSAEAMAACDVVAPDINAALDLLIKPNRLIATLRK